MYIKTLGVHFDALTITVVILGSYIGKLYWGEAQNEGYFWKIPIIQHDTNFISQTVGQTNFL